MHCSEWCRSKQYVQSSQCFVFFQQRIADIEKNGCIEQRKFVAKHKAQVLNGKNMKETKP